MDADDRDLDGMDPVPDADLDGMGLVPDADLDEMDLVPDVDLDGTDLDADQDVDRDQDVESGIVPLPYLLKLLLGADSRQSFQRGPFL